MGLFSFARRGQRDVITAAVEPVHKIKDAPPQKYASNDKQKRAWLHYDMVPEMWVAHNMVANMLARCRIFPAIQPDPGQPPIPLTPTDGAIGARANAELDRLRDVDGSHGKIIHDMTIQLCVPGEGLFAMYPDPDDGQEVTKIFSLDELVVRDGHWVIREKEEAYEGRKIGKDIEDGGEVLVQRFWRPHPRFSHQADSAFFALRKPLDELLILDQLYRSNARSRVAAGLLIAPAEIQLKERNQAHRSPRGRGGGPQSQLDPLVELILRALTQPLEDEESAGNVAPPVIKAPGDLIEKFRHMTFGREFDANTAARYDRVLKRCSDGVDLPSAFVTGIEDVNHWTAWQIDEDAFDDHLAPLMQLDCSSLTQAFFGPALADIQTPADERVFIWYDASALLTHPNKATDALKANEQILISDASARKYMGYTEDDAPDEAEIARKEERQKAKQATPPGQPGPPEPERSTLVASAFPLDTLGLELARLDHDLRVQLQASLEGVVLRSVDSAGNRVRAAALDDTVNARPFHIQLEGVHNDSVCRVLGRDVVRRFATDEELTEEAIAAALPVYTRHVSRAQRKLRSIAQEYDADVDLDEMEAQQEADRQRGAVALAGVLAAIIIGKLYSPAVDAPAQGELDDFSIPAGSMRKVLATAGGSPFDEAVSPMTDVPQGGVTTGDTAREILLRVSLTPDGWQWVYGDAARKRSFPGHRALNGVTFLDWTDEKLRVDERDAWLRTDFYHPGDHLYCQCDFAPVMTQDDTTNPTEPALVET